MSQVVANRAFMAVQPAHRPPVQVPVSWKVRRFILELAIMSSGDRKMDRYRETVSPVRCEVVV